MADPMDTSLHPTSQAQQGFVDNWQGGKSLAECNRHMLNEEDTCDVIFRVGDEGQIIKAHRYVLISRSCVFYSMFIGPLAETSEVGIPDVEVKHFRTFLSYLYTDETTVDADNVTAVLYTARKYAVTGLETQCRKFLSNNLTAENACTILQEAHRFDERELYEKSFSLILKVGNQAIESPGFLELTQELVGKITLEDELSADEVVLFEAVNKWTESECKRKGLEICPETKRSVLGDVVKNIRFSWMKPAFISQEVKISGLLSDTERVNILDSIICEEPHSTSCRPYTQETVTRFPRHLTYLPSSGRVDAVSFKCNKRIYLHGIKLYGPLSGTATYTVTSYFGTEESVMSTEIQAATEYTTDDVTYEVLFSRPSDLLADAWYEVAITLKGPKTYKGTDGAEQVQCKDGLTFNFKKSTHSTSSTNVSAGQIPSLVYSVARA